MSKNAATNGNNDVPKMNAAERRKARRAAERRQAQLIEEAKMRKKDSEMQTCPEGWLLCPWCTKVSNYNFFA